MSNPATPSMALFRREALEYAGSRSQGELLLVQPSGQRWVVRLLIVWFLAILTYLALGSYSRTATVSGALVPTAGVLRIVAAQPGVITACPAGEGIQAQAGDVLFALRTQRASDSVGDAELTIGALLQTRRDSLEAESHTDQEQVARRIEAAHVRRLQLEAEVRSGEQQYELQQQRVSMASMEAERYATLLQRGFIAAAQLQERQAELLDQRQRLAEIEHSLGGYRREIKAAEQEVREQRLQALREQETFKRELAVLAQSAAENLVRRDWQIRAPQPGTVSAVSVEVGQSVVAGQTLAALVPPGSALQAELYVPSRAVGLLRPGMPVHLRYQAFPYQKFGLQRGVISEISATAQQLDARSEAVYRVRVALEQQTIPVYGRLTPLMVGAAVDATVLLERRRLYEWLLDPLYSLEGRS